MTLVWFFVRTANGNFGEIVLLATWAVLIAELVGDRSIYALATLALRFRWVVVFLAFALANAIKMAVAVLLAHAIAYFHPCWTYLVSALAFFISAILIWEDESHEISESGGQTGWSKVCLFLSALSSSPNGETLARLQPRPWF